MVDHDGAFNLESPSTCNGFLWGNNTHENSLAK